jgi:hypothetical protein
MTTKSDFGLGFRGSKKSQSLNIDVVFAEKKPQPQAGQLMAIF